MPISSYLFVNTNSRLPFSIPFSSSLSSLRISTYICFYLLFMHLYLFISLFQSKLMPISSYLFVNPNSRLPFSIPFSSSQSILCISIYICFCLFSIPPLLLPISCLSKFTYISFNSLLLISTHNSYIDLYLFLSFCDYKFTDISFNVLLFIIKYNTAHPTSIYLYHFLSLVFLSLCKSRFNVSSFNQTHPPPPPPPPHQIRSYNLDILYH